MSASGPPQIRPVTLEQHPAFVGAIARNFGTSLDSAEIDELVDVELVDGSQPIAAHDGVRMIGTSVVLPWTLALPYAPPVPCAAVTSVTVAPTHRRRGVLRSLMRNQLDTLHNSDDEGAAWAALYSSESVIYGRFGYGVATRSVTGRIDRPWTGFSEPVRPAEVELLPVDDALDRVPAIYASVQERTPGMLDVPARYWRHRIAWDPPGDRDGASERTVAVIGDRAYAMYRVANDWDEAGSKSRLTIEECHATDVEAHRQMWSYLFAIDLVQHITISRLSVDHPLPWWLTERQRLRLAASMPLYIRLVDVGAALSQRGTHDKGEVVIDVTDGFCPWNQRRWGVTGDGGVLHCEPTDAAADVAIDVRELASLSLGGVTPSELAHAGLVDERAPGALAQLEALLASPRQPYNAFTF